MRGSRWLSFPIALVALATTLWVSAPTAVKAADLSVLQGETVRCDATASEGHPQSFEWRIFDPDGQPVPVEPGAIGIVDLVMDSPGVWQVGIDAHYAHIVGKDPWTSSFEGTIQVSSVIASLTSIPAGSPLQIPISSSFVLDGTGSRIGQGADIQATWSYSDGGAWYTLSECSGASGSVADPSELTCTVTGNYLGAGDWTLRMDLEDTISGETASAEVEVVITNIEVDFSWLPVHPDPGETVVLTVLLAGGAQHADIDHVTWEFGDSIIETDNCQYTQCRQWSHIYDQSGVYTVHEEIEFLSGEIQIAFHEIIVGTPPAAPTASFTVDLNQTQVPAQATLTFTGSCEAPCSYTWYFGDGGSASGSGDPSPQIRTYTTAGDYTIRLEVSNTTDSDASQQVISLTAPPPVQAVFVDGFEKGTGDWSDVVGGS
jgi:PKD repeat protein